MKRPAAGPLSGHTFTVTPDEAERFWSYVTKRGDDECWEWGGYRSTRHGYGAFNLYRVRPGPIPAHRVSWVIANGRPIPPGVCVLHDCDNKPCVNPNHLHLGTHADNCREAIERNRIPSTSMKRCRDCGVIERCGRGGYHICTFCKAQRRVRRDYLRRAHRHEIARAALTACPPSTFEHLAAVTDPRRAEAYARYFGLYDRTPQTLERIGQTYGITRERVRQLVADTADKILRGFDHLDSEERAAA